MFEGQESKRLDVMLEFYRQACLNMRMFVDLRFKHFTTLMVITGILGAAAFNVQVASSWRPYIQVLALVVTVLFWLIDYRTTQYWRHESAKVQTFERALNEGAHLLLPPAERTHLRSSTATNLLFATMVLAWLTSLTEGLLAPDALPPTTIRAVAPASTTALPQASSAPVSIAAPSPTASGPPRFVAE